MISRMCELLALADRNGGDDTRVYAIVTTELRDGSPVVIPPPVHPEFDVKSAGRIEWEQDKVVFRINQQNRGDELELTATSWPDPDLRRVRIMLTAENQRMWLHDYMLGARLHGAPVLAIEPLIVWRSERRGVDPEVAAQREIRFRNRRLQGMFGSPVGWPLDVAKTWPEGNHPRVILETRST